MPYVACMHTRVWLFPMTSYKARVANAFKNTNSIIELQLSLQGMTATSATVSLKLRPLVKLPSQTTDSRNLGYAYTGSIDV